MEKKTTTVTRQKGGRGKRRKRKDQKPCCSDRKGEKAPAACFLGVGSDRVEKKNSEKEGNAGVGV